MGLINVLRHVKHESNRCKKCEGGSGHRYRKYSEDILCVCLRCVWRVDSAQNRKFHLWQDKLDYGGQPQYGKSMGHTVAKNLSQQINLKKYPIKIVFLENGFGKSHCPPYQWVHRLQHILPLKTGLWSETNWNVWIESHTLHHFYLKEKSSTQVSQYIHTYSLLYGNHDCIKLWESVPLRWRQGRDDGPQLWMI